MEPGIERNKYICSESANSFIDFTDCLYTAKQENKFSFMLYAYAFNLEKDIIEVVSIYNEKCPGYSFVIPDFLN